MKPRLCLVIPIWQRPVLTNHLLTYYHQLAVPGIDVSIVVVGSEGDVSRRIARGLWYVEAKNDPLDRKYDAGFEYSQRLNPDAVCLVGSDDFITEPYFSWGMARLAQDRDLVGLLDFYLVDLATERVLYWAGYRDSARRGEPIAAGRMYSRRLLDRIDWKPHWSAGGYAGCHQDDERAFARASAAHARVETINMAQIGCQYWAVKSGQEFNPTAAFERDQGVVDVTPHAHRLFRTTILL